MDINNELEKIMSKLGDFGRYQKFQFLLQVLASIPTGVTMFSVAITAGVPNHRCAIEGVDTTTYTEPWNSSLVTNAIPSNKYGKLDSCHIYADNNTLEECTSWVYDTTYYKSTRAIDWDFVCSRRWMGAAAQSIFMTGVILSSLILGPLCDTFGRRTIYLWTSTLQLIIGILVAFTTDFITYVVLRFIYGIFAISPFKAAYVLMIELVGPRQRALCGASIQIFAAIGVMLIGIWGYLIENRFYLQIILALHTAILLPHWFLLDESPRWLWAKGRVREAVAIVQKGLKINKSGVTINAPQVISQYIALSNSDIRSTSILDLFRTRNMAKKSTIICGCFYAAAVVYYGLGLNTGKLGGNPFLMLFFSGLVEIPGYIIGMCFVNKIGNRAILSSSMVLSGISCLITAVLPPHSTEATAAAMVGKFLGSASFTIVYKYGAELFPTVVRSSGVGFATMCASVSAALTPLIILLDSFKPEYPAMVFGLSALVFGLLAMFLPETRGRKLPQTLEDGEKFGVGQTCFTDCGCGSSSNTSESPDVLEPLKFDNKSLNS